jgi:hypothetical protein
MSEIVAHASISSALKPLPAAGEPVAQVARDHDRPVELCIAIRPTASSSALPTDHESGGPGAVRSIAAVERKPWRAYADLRDAMKS